MLLICPIKKMYRSLFSQNTWEIISAVSEVFQTKSIIFGIETNNLYKLSSPRPDNNFPNTLQAKANCQIVSIE